MTQILDLLASANDSDKMQLLTALQTMKGDNVTSEIAKILRGKHKASFTPHVDCGDNVIVLNADKIRLTGDKLNAKKYIRHTGYPGGQRVVVAKNMMAKHPERMVENAIKGMLPKNKLGSELFRNLHVVVGAEHKYEAQKPKVVDLNTIK